DSSSARASTRIAASESRRSPRWNSDDRSRSTSARARRSTPRRSRIGSGSEESHARGRMTQSASAAIVARMDFARQAPRRWECRIHVGRGARAGLGTRMQALLPPPRQAVLVTDRNVAPFWLADAEEKLEAAGYSTHSLLVPSGEESKSLRILG